MPYTAPSTVSAGQTYASAAHNVIVNDIIDHESRLLTVQNTQYPFRNILLNGAMQVSQRATSVSGITSGQTYNTADRWVFSVSAGGTWTQAVSADAPTGSGFRNSLRVTATVSAVTGAGTYVLVGQRLEGQTLQHLKKGTSSAQQLTASFWVKSNKTGTYIVEIQDVDNTRSVSASYTVNAADTWENKTITFPADTTGALDNDNALSLVAQFWLSAGTNFTSGSLQTSWNTTTSANQAVGQTNLAGATNQYLAITGVQLEPGNVASPYEFVLYQDELRRCQRYYQMNIAGTAFGPIGWGFANSTSLSTAYIPTKTVMRANPIIGSFANLRVFDVSTASAVTGIVITQANPLIVSLDVTTAAVLTVARPTVLQGNNNAAGYVDFFAEL